jgi:hypothetical protein
MFAAPSLVTLRAMPLLLFVVTLASPIFAQQRKPVVLYVDAPDTDIDCPKVETALKDAFALSPRYELADFDRFKSSMFFTVSCLSLSIHDAQVISIYYTIQNFDDNAKSKTNPTFSTESTAHKLIVSSSPKAVGNSLLVSFDQSVNKHYKQ